MARLPDSHGAGSDVDFTDGNGSGDWACTVPAIAIVGAGPAGLMAAEACAAAGARVDVFDAMPSVGRKFLLAGKGGLNLTHAQEPAVFRRQYAGAQDDLRPSLDAFGPDALRAWAHELGIDTFVGTSGRVFPREMKAAPLLRAWLHRLRQTGVTFHSRHRWIGWGDGPPPPDAATKQVRRIRLRLAATGPGNGQADRDIVVAADAVVLALGGGSWSRLGSDGNWLPLLAGRGVAIAALAPANCGFDCAWSDHFGSRFSGAPMKSVAVSLAQTRSGTGADVADAPALSPRRGEFVITASGVEGSLVYSIAAAARDRIVATGSALLQVDLLADRSEAWVRQALARPRGSRSMANHLRRCLGLDGAKAGLLRECAPAGDFGDAARLAGSIKRLPLRLLSPRPLHEAISTAGGVRFEALDDRLMLRTLPGVFCAGEMLDWEAPTGGYLLTACFATGLAAGRGAIQWLAGARPADPP